MRILHGLPFQPPKEAVFEDYVKVWIHDMSLELQKAFAKGGMVTPDEIGGLNNLGKHIGMFLEEMARNEDEKEKVKEYEDAFGQLMNHVKGLEQRLQQAMKAQAKQAGAGAQGGNGKDAAKVQAMLIQAQTKAKIAENSAAARTRQKEEQFQKAEARKDQQVQADIQRQGVETRHELLANRLKALSE